MEDIFESLKDIDMSDLGDYEPFDGGYWKKDGNILKNLN